MMMNDFLIVGYSLVDEDQNILMDIKRYSGQLDDASADDYVYDDDYLKSIGEQLSYKVITEIAHVDDIANMDDIDAENFISDSLGYAMIQFTKELTTDQISRLCECEYWEDLLDVLDSGFSFYIDFHGGVPYDYED